MEENTVYLVSDWQYEVANGDTVLGYHEWVEHKRESDNPRCKHPNLKGRNEYKTCEVCKERVYFADPWSDR